MGGVKFFGSLCHAQLNWKLTLFFETSAAAEESLMILLSECDGCDGMEIVIGGYDNTRCVIREKKEGPNLAEKKVIFFWQSSNLIMI